MARRQVFDGLTHRTPLTRERMEALLSVAEGYLDDAPSQHVPPRFKRDLEGGIKALKHRLEERWPLAR